MPDPKQKQQEQTTTQYYVHNQTGETFGVVTTKGRKLSDDELDRAYNNVKAQQVYRQKFLSDPNDGSIPNILLHRAINLPPDSRLNAQFTDQKTGQVHRLSDLSDIGQSAILDAANQQAGNGFGSLSYTPPAPPNLFQRGLGMVNNVLSTPTAALKAVVEPADVSLRQHFGGLNPQDADDAEMQRIAALPFLQRMDELRGQSFGSLGQPARAASLHAGETTLSPVGRLGSAGINTVGQMALDPISYAGAGLANVLKAPLASKALTAGFVVPQAGNIAQEIASGHADPYELAAQLPLLGLGLLHLATPHGSPAPTIDSGSAAGINLVDPTQSGYSFRTPAAPSPGLMSEPEFAVNAPGRPIEQHLAPADFAARTSSSADAFAPSHVYHSADNAAPVSVQVLTDYNGARSRVRDANGRIFKTSNSNLQPLDSSNAAPSATSPAEPPTVNIPDHLRLTPEDTAALHPDIQAAYRHILNTAPDFDFTRQEAIEAAHQLSTILKEQKPNVSTTPPTEPTAPTAATQPAALTADPHGATSAADNTRPASGTDAAGVAAPPFPPRPAEAAGTQASQAGSGTGIGEPGIGENQADNALRRDAGTSPTERGNSGSAAEPNPVFSPIGENPQRAGSINLRNLDTPEAVKAEIYRTAQEQSAQIEQSRGKVSHAETVETARQLNMSVADLEKATPGQGAAFHLALRNLVTATAEKLKTAADTYRSDPSDANQIALQAAQAEHGTVLNAATGHISELGRSMSALNIAAKAADAGRAGEGTAPTPGHVESLFRPETAPKNVDPKSSGYGSRNKLVSQSDAAAARLRLQRGLSQANAGIDPALLVDAAKLGLFHLEAGLRAFPAWAAQMKQDVPGLSEGDLQTTWAGLKAEAQKTQQNRAQSHVFVDQLAQRIGRQNSASFVEALRDEHGSTELLHKLVTGDTLTPEEGQKVASAYLDNQPVRAGKREARGAMATLNELVKEARVEARTVTMRNRGTNKPAATAEQAFNKRLVQKYGRAGAERFTQQIGGDIHGKMLSGTELSSTERQQIADAHAAAVRPKATPAEQDAASQTLKEIIAEAKTQAQQQAQTGSGGKQPAQPQTPADVAKRLLLQDSKADADRIAAKLASIDPHDHAAIHNIIREESKVPLAQQLVNFRKVGLISSPRTVTKILVSHGIAMLADEAASYPAAIMDGVASRYTGQRTMTAARPQDLLQAAREGIQRGIPEGATIARFGEEAAKQKGVEPIGSDTNDVFHSRVLTNNPALDGVLNKVLDLHGGAYRPFRVAALKRSIQNQARVTALNEGLTGKAAETRVQSLVSDPTPEMMLNGMTAVSESLLFNPNKTTQVVSAAKRAAGPGLSAASDFLLPFPRISSNIVGRMLEHAFGVPLSLSRAAMMRSKGLPFTLAEQERFSKTFGRGAVGMGAIALGWKLAQAGVLSGNGNDKDFDGGSLHLGGRVFKVSNEGPLPAALTLGATWYELSQQPNPAYRSAAIKTLEENPVVGAGEQFFNPHDPTGKAFIGNNVGSFIPTAIADIAAQSDPTTRKKENALSYVENRIPALRNTLPDAGYPAPTLPLLDPTGSKAEGSGSSGGRGTRVQRMRSRGRSRR